MMTSSEIFALRRDGRTAEAYEAARVLYAADKHPLAASAMFWTAADMLRLCADEGRTDEASRILKALQRLLPHVPDKEGWAQTALKRCEQLLGAASSVNNSGVEPAEHLQMGHWGEEIATAYLRDKGYVILERDWHSKHRDIDIIALQGSTVVFIEVKTRHDTVYMRPEQAVDYRKRQNLRRAINHYLKYRNVGYNARFDIITVVGDRGSTRPQINHIEDVDIMH